LTTRGMAIKQSTGRRDKSRLPTRNQKKRGKLGKSGARGTELKNCTRGRVKKTKGDQDSAVECKGTLTKKKVQ